MSIEHPFENIELPEKYVLPDGYLALIARNIRNLNPWFILESGEIRTRTKQLSEHYPARRLIPFAERDDNDDVACWEVSRPNTVIIIHNYASAGFEEKKEYPEFWDWFKDVVDEIIQFES